jgi:hypothetical protein
MTTHLPDFTELALVPESVFHPLCPECPVCLGEHDAEIHAATLSIRRWFRREVTKGFWMYQSHPSQ